jgi:myo-inositol-1(or 4)-monophosphatase
MDALDKYFTIACQAVQLAKSTLLEAIGPAPCRLGAVDKGGSDFQTTLDVRIEQQVSSYLRDWFPGHTVVGEELPKSSGDSELTWYLDPIDGTHNLLMGRPEIAISLALYDGQEPLVAIIDLPLREQSFAAYGHDRVRPPRNAFDRQDRRTLVGIPGEFRRTSHQIRIARLINKTNAPLGLRCSGALAYDLATMLMGELDARVSFSAKSVDMAAGAALLKCAGCIVTNLDGSPFSPWSGDIAASWSPELHRMLVSHLCTEGGPDGDE